MTATFNRRTQIARVHHVQGAALAQWRASIRLAARNAGAVILTAPVFISISFGCVRPQAQTRLLGGKRIPLPKYINARPAVAPDLDKLVRAVLDALTGVCYEDDAQVVSLGARKVYSDRTRILVDYAEQFADWLEEDTPENPSQGQTNLSLL
jgi:Holliday junction resolvase RusA-like endonuclease